ncbi:TetR family transcriptional regulator [Shimia isoporae]|uniref:TetR family transcriptional regulator n=1 Tax=Shimia isoporae TaxID=647720 RepID=A0A4R1N6R3_9RHOB|nr:TetR/AcrR family transcriptional regulator [Shimia isoporae]TCL00457.1 TetR family transcriptional regulator [Shimia isoporae]
MNNPSLNSDDWLDVAIGTLKIEGHTGLRALPLAKKLGVTRGSFYHHFESLEAFHVEVVAHWAKVSSGQVIRNAKDTLDPRQALDDLLQTTLLSGAELERAIRSWATVKDLVAVEVAKVDHERIAVAHGLLIGCGVSDPVAASRAKIIYWAAIGRLMMPYPEKSVLSETEISDFARLMAFE